MSSALTPHTGAPASSASRRPPRLQERFVADAGEHFMSGMQALVRLPIESARRDRGAGLRTGTFISGYPGSPLAGYDLALERAGSLLGEHGVVHVPAGNEEQAATACMGTQMLDAYPHSDVDGVTAFWYGKGPGLDRSGDAIKHGNFAGTSRLGAVVMLVGDDHEAKSSTMPYQEEQALAAAGIPVLYPASVSEFLSLGLHAVAMSRFTGCWAALKLTNPLCDGGEVVDLGERADIRVPGLEIAGGPFVKRTDFSFYPGKNIDMERHLYDERHVAVHAYARANRLDQTVVQGSSDTLGVLAAGKSWTDLRQALADLNISDGDLRAAGVRLRKLGLVYPLDADGVREFASGLDAVMVVEEKRGFVEDQVKAALQPLGRAIRVVGKRDVDGAVLYPVYGAFGADLIARRVADFLSEALPQVRQRPRLAELEAIGVRDVSVPAARTPNYCSGCPHNASTLLADGQVAWGAPGCGCFGTVIEQPRRHIDTMTQYGGEGLPWVGLAPFVDRPHMIQQVGDGSFYHSSGLNIRWAVATRTRMTFKILYNGAVANTGAQDAPGARGVAALTRLLEAEGVERCVVATKEPRQYRGQRLGQGTEVRRAGEMLRISQEMERASGVTVLIYDESCANERRRKRKRGLEPPAAEFVTINTAVCEACGDCGAASNCMSLQQVPTELGSKTQVHASSCNQDLACLKGDCPSFVTVRAAGSTTYRKPTYPDITEPIAEPELPEAGSAYSIAAPGVGGTGVITLNALLAEAAAEDGLHARTYDQTGAAQKWGPVLSTLILSTDGATHPSTIVGAGHLDLMLALDEVGAVSQANQVLCSAARTRMVVNTDLFPTGEMVRDVKAVVDRPAIAERLAHMCRPDGMLGVPARTIAETIFGDYMVTNMVVLGAAYQWGWLPISARAIEGAIALNGVAVRANVQAFRYGRMWVVQPKRITDVIAPPRSTADEEIGTRSAALPARHRDAYRALVGRIQHHPEPLRRDLVIRVAELINYQGPSLAERYLDRVEAMQDAVAAAGTDSAPVQSVARGLFKLLAYKDEYEVARLHTAPDFRSHLARTFDNVSGLRFHLAPPVLRRIGYSGKVTVPRWLAIPIFHVLTRLRFLRGTSFDPFGRQASRREERELIDWYLGLADVVEHKLRPGNLQVALKLLSLPDSIRGYEAVKSGNARAARSRSDGLLAQLDRPLLDIISTRPT
jgi:indolepyruvate ferredoxin oxidoreductase